MASCISSQGESINPLPRESITASLLGLPQELREQIFSNLSAIDLQNVASVNRTLNSSVIEAVNFREPHVVKEFVEYLIKNLDSERFSTQKELLLGIAQNIKVHQFPTLLQVKSYILDLKTQLINVLKTINYESRFNLEDQVQPPDFLEDIFEIASLEEDIDQANLIPDEYQRDLALADVINDHFHLLCSVYIDRAIELAKSISDEAHREGALVDIFRYLLEVNHVEKAIEVASSFEDISDFTLMEICQSLLEANHIERAIEVASSFPNEKGREGALLEVCRYLLESNHIEKAGSILRRLPIPMTLGSDSEYLLALEHVERGI